MQSYLCRAQIPYPTALATSPSTEFLPLLFGLYSGEHGEFTMVANLLFYELILPNEQEELRNILDSVAIVDRNHFRMLGRLILQCGGTPQLAAPRKKGMYWWSGGFLDYTSDCRLVLQEVCRAKETSISAYEQALDLCKDEGMKKVFLRILEDELCQLAVFERFLATAEETK